MKLDLKFKENAQRLDLGFGQYQDLTDGGYERGYSEGYEAGNAEGYTKGHEEGYTNGYEQGEASFIQSKPERVENDVVTSIRGQAFYGGSFSAPTYVYFKNAKSVGRQAFMNCRSLVEAYFDSVTSIEADAFYLCQSLNKLVIRTPIVCTLLGKLTNNAIASGTGFIYVPDNLVEQYKGATNWSAHASQIKPISELEDYPEISG